MGQVFNKGFLKRLLKGLLKRPKNFEDKTDNQLKENKDSQLGITFIGYKFKETLSQKAKIEFDKIVDKERSINY